MNNIDKMRRGQDILKWIQDGDLRAMIDEVVEMTYEWRQYKDRQLTNLEALFPHPAVVDVANRTGLDLARFSVVQLGGPMIDPALNLDGFKAGPGFAGLIPTKPPDLARFAILLDAMPAGNGRPPYPVARGVIAGAAAVQVNVTSTLHGFAVPVAGTVNALQSTSMAAGAVILTRPTQTGVQWLNVALGRCCATNFAQSAGSSQGISAGCACGPGALAQVCLRFPGTTVSCIGSGTGVTLNFDGGYIYNSAVLSCNGHNVQILAFTCLGISGVEIFTVDGGGNPDGVMEANYTSAGEWDCQSAQSWVLSSWSGDVVGVLGTLPRTVTLWPCAAPCSDTGCAGGGGGGACCGNTDATRTVVLSGALAFLGSQSLAKTAADNWSTFVVVGGCQATLVVYCNGDHYDLIVRLSDGVTQSQYEFALTTAACSPFHLTGTFPIPAYSPCTSGGTFGVDVT